MRECVEKGKRDREAGGGQTNAPISISILGQKGTRFTTKFLYDDLQPSQQSRNCAVHRTGRGRTSCVSNTCEYCTRRECEVRLAWKRDTPTHSFRSLGSKSPWIRGFGVSPSGRPLTRSAGIIRRSAEETQKPNLFFLRATPRFSLWSSSCVVRFVSQTTATGAVRFHALE